MIKFETPEKYKVFTDVIVNTDKINRIELFRKHVRIYFDNWAFKYMSISLTEYNKNQLRKLGVI